MVIGHSVMLFMPSWSTALIELDFILSGDEIVVTTRTDTQNDWWEGRLKGKVGIFPANFVRLKT